MEERQPEQDHSEEKTKFSSFDDFFPYYLKEHSLRSTRFVHFAGTSVALLFLLEFLVTLNFKFIIIGLVSVYGPAFLSHFYFEKNNPATFKHPFYSVGGDLKMWYLMLTGKIKI
jgi:hypothetical protein